ncbi:MAG: DUF5110 domain-containing protein [Gammaproteobacteria bacterium]|nr:DUF5110 domain-containing protein [Gammaproteobacteria bacterium]
MPTLPVRASPAPASAPRVQILGDGVDLHLGQDLVTLRLVRDNVLRVHFEPGGRTTPGPLVTAPDAPHDAAGVTVNRHGGFVTLASRAVLARINTRTLTLSVFDADHNRLLLRQPDLFALASRRLKLRFAEGAPLYGIHGFRALPPPDDKNRAQRTALTALEAAGLLRRGWQIAAAGSQGNAGAPFVWSTDGFGLLVDSKGAVFDLEQDHLTVSRSSRPDLDYDLITGTPTQIFAALADLSGHPPLFPKWAMGFTNSQWGIDQQELLDIVRTYRARHIPIDNFTLDFDWKAWGEDDYGEFRWNGKKFPDGPSGKLAKMLAAEGIHLTGIMKPRIHVDTVEGRYASAHHLWVAGEKAHQDYFSRQLVRDIDFDKPAARRWFGALAIKYAFDKGIIGWWNDEADETGDDTQFLDMERALYGAQRAHTDVRVWSINRNFWLGAQRYAYGLWSGDISTGFARMAAQRAHMLSAVDVGEMQWGMDSGGFNGHPTPENYARWIEFGAFTPIFRVHGNHGEKRQPWRYGAIAETAAVHAIRLRYRLLPYIYAYAWHDHVAGIGLVRPLIFDWPRDPKVRNDTDAWMFGDWLLVSPVVKPDTKEKWIYLPAGGWTGYFTGKTYRGGQTVTVPVDRKTWLDIPLFIRAGAIIPTQPVMDYVGQNPAKTITVDIFPTHRRTTFDYYDDDGETYAYEHGAYFLQRLSTQRIGGSVRFDTAAPAGAYRPALEYYLVKVHGLAAGAVRGVALRLADPAAVQAHAGEGWATSLDRYGAVTCIKLVAGQQRSLRLSPADQRP